jgi:NTP pyrophosphatase (non-canonical NTP hydrolase)
MNFKEYQIAARKTAIYPAEYKIIYPTLELADEVGEVCGKIKKRIRDWQCDFSTGVFKEDIALEMGDILWPLANLASDLDLNLEDIATKNISKLQDRQKRNVLKGQGDNR